MPIDNATDITLLKLRHIIIPYLSTTMDSNQFIMCDIKMINNIL